MAILFCILLVPCCLLLAYSLIMRQKSRRPGLWTMLAMLTAFGTFTCFFGTSVIWEHVRLNTFEPKYQGEVVLTLDRPASNEWDLVAQLPNCPRETRISRVDQGLVEVNLGNGRSVLLPTHPAQFHTGYPDYQRIEVYYDWDGRIIGSYDIQADKWTSYLGNRYRRPIRSN